MSDSYDYTYTGEVPFGDEDDDDDDDFDAMPDPWASRCSVSSHGKEDVGISVRCPSCNFIVHVISIEFPVRVSSSPSGKEVRIWLECEHGHRSAIEIEDHSGTMTLSARSVNAEAERSYKEYLASPGWYDKAEAAKKRAGYRCQVCNMPKDRTTLNTHHRTYQRIFHEDDADLIVLCKECHTLFHENRKLAR